LRVLQASIKVEANAEVVIVESSSHGEVDD